ncbi:dihydropteroate synthase [Actinotalea sp. M2MS4P-6]|uniref:dihydropteroate synthase n=1 Tax=Actinotalea sp. M2MS4P-6 TaxID=2983762 RepID=UPI0021E4A317|nr:dihydropteroate synthase [Actinotalea sp. M2MS4P-6]MCV2393472.1 dihydropteroate synthase [Actinotalea sp. M2MS4P-6]
MQVPLRSPDLWLRGRAVCPGRAAVMAVVNRTADSFYPAARAADTAAAVAAVEVAVRDGADLVDIGGVRAGRGEPVGVTEEIDRVRPVVVAVRERFADLPISVDTWRAEVAEAVAGVGVDLINDTWAGHDPDLVGVAGRHGLGVVVSHTGGAEPRTDPLRVVYPDGVLADVLATLRSGAERAVAAGVDPRSVLVDPTHDFGKTTWHSLELLRATDEIAGLGYPTLMALSRKDFVGESLGLPVDERLEGTLAASAVALWLGAGVLRAHDVRATRRVSEMVAVLRGDLPPARAVRGLA